MPGALILIVIVLVIMVFLWDHSKFGHNRAALAKGQKIATDVGINEKKNALICYIIAGGLLGLAGVVYISKFGSVSPETGLGSSTYFMTAFLPFFIGGAIENTVRTPSAYIWAQSHRQSLYADCQKSGLLPPCRQSSTASLSWRS